ncbi:MAG: nuclear transport factor 2 family protein [Pseudolabrys sp.]|nr:nuclear transport factor 2 family protein [Pseudolabrys sp.]
MSDLGTRAAVRDLYGAYARGDQARVALLLHEDIDWAIYSPVTVFPFAGARRGRAAVLEAMAAIAAVYEMETYKVEQTIIDGDRAAILADAGFKQRATGRLIRFRVAHFLRFNDGRLIEFREFADSFDLVEQAIGHTVDV